MSYRTDNVRKPPGEGRAIALALTGVAIGVASLCLVILSLSLPLAEPSFEIPDQIRGMFALTGVFSLYSAASLIDWVMDSLTECEYAAIDETDIYADFKPGDRKSVV